MEVTTYRLLDKLICADSLKNFGIAKENGDIQTFSDLLYLPQKSFI